MTGSTLMSRYLPPADDALREIADGILARRAISVRQYKDVPFGQSLWTSGDAADRTWLFLLHSFAPLDALMATGALEATTDLVRDWAAAFGTYSEDELKSFPWHDHATARRLDRLSILSMLTGDMQLPDLARTHAELLLREDFYSRHTNHGFDQALSLLLASKAYAAACDTSAWQRTGLDRLVGELKFAFSDEGVHVENSPGYHAGMTTNVVRAQSILTALEIAIDFDFAALLDKALLFTAWITGPDRKLALLGDTTERGGRPPPDLAHLENYAPALWAATGGQDGSPRDARIAVYPQSGYAIYRSDWQDWRNHVHLVMKSGFLSKYHRHDDDLNILLQGHGEHWLIDSGLYRHNQTDPARVYMRSALAHNVPYITGARADRRVPGAATAPTIALDDSARPDAIGVIRATSQMYRTVRMTRTLIVEDADRFQIVDQFRHAGPDPGTFIQFHVPRDKTVSVSPGMARIAGRQKQLTIRLASGEVGGCKLFSGLNGPFKSARSRVANQLETSQVIVFGPLKGDRVRFKLEFV